MLTTFFVALVHARQKVGVWCGDAGVVVVSYETGVEALPVTEGALHEKGVGVANEGHTDEVEGREKAEGGSDLRCGKGGGVGKSLP